MVCNYHTGLIIAAFANRVKFPAYMYFPDFMVIILLLSFSTHGLGRWNNSKLGVRDFAGE